MMKKNKKDNYSLNIFDFYEDFCRAKGFFGVKERIKGIKRIIKYSWQRITKGYSDYDLWDMDLWISRLLANAFSDFAKCNNGYPFNSTYEDWTEYINTMAKLFESYSLENKCEEDFSVDNINTPEFNKLNKKWREEEIKLNNGKISNINKALDMLKENYGSFWW